jgi:hypothetical protein
MGKIFDNVFFYKTTSYLTNMAGMFLGWSLGQMMVYED